jgi:hypothetical protein
MPLAGLRTAGKDSFHTAQLRSTFNLAQDKDSDVMLGWPPA